MFLGRGEGEERQSWHALRLSLLSSFGGEEACTGGGTEEMRPETGATGLKIY